MCSPLLTFELFFQVLHLEKNERNRTLCTEVDYFYYLSTSFRGLLPTSSGAMHLTSLHLTKWVVAHESLCSNNKNSQLQCTMFCFSHFI